MSVFPNVIAIALSWLPTFLVLAIGILILGAFKHFLITRASRVEGETKLSHQLLMLVLTVVCILALILALPISDTMRGQILSLLGIFMAAAISLSSTTFLGNMMAGLMLRAVENMQPGDFVRVGDHFGRISERGLLHTEIQTEDRDLTTLPNSYLVTNPVRVVRSSGTIVSATVSIGYDVHHEKVCSLLEKAVEKTALETPFAHIMELGDHSVSYKAAGFLKDVKSLISARSKLRESILDVFHQAKVEIVSPTFMNQRVWDAKSKFIPSPYVEHQPTNGSAQAPEAVIFDKADAAETLEQLKIKQKDLVKDIDAFKTNFEKAQDDKERQELSDQIMRAEHKLSHLDKLIALRKQDQG